MDLWSVTTSTENVEQGTFTIIPQSWHNESPPCHTATADHCRDGRHTESSEGVTDAMTRRRPHGWACSGAHPGKAWGRRGQVPVLVALIGRRIVHIGAPFQDIARHPCSRRVASRLTRLRPDSVPRARRSHRDRHCAGDATSPQCICALERATCAISLGERVLCGLA